MSRGPKKRAAPDVHPAPETPMHAGSVARSTDSREQKPVGVGYRLIALAEKCADRADSWSAAEVAGHPYPAVCRGIETMLRDLADDILNAATEREADKHAPETPERAGDGQRQGDHPDTPAG